MPTPVCTPAELGLYLAANTPASDLIGAAYGVGGVLLREQDLAPEYFVLSSGLLGELFQKLSNYRLPTALVLPHPAAYGQRMAELTREHATHPLIRWVATEAQGKAWLEALP